MVGRRANGRISVEFSRRSALLTVAAVASLAACGTIPDDGDPSADRAVTGLTPGDVMGFEVAAAWASSSGTVLATTTRTQGEAALAITAPVRFTKIVSASIDSSATPLVGLGASNSAFAVDLLLPTQQPNPSFLGSLQLYVSVPSRNVHNQFLGNVDLTGRPLGVFRTALFAVNSFV